MMTTPSTTTPLILAALTTLALAVAPSTAAAGASSGGAPGHAYGLAADQASLREQVGEPLFAFVFLMTEADSLGTWTADDLLAFADRWGRASDFPLAEHLESLTREPLTGDGALERRGVRCQRRWVVRLRPARLEMPMPYSILGYHPGKLSFDSPIELREWQLGAVEVDVRADGGTRRVSAEAVTVWQIASGWIILDVDTWLDKLLGEAADDAAMEGFTAGWVGGDLIGVGNSAGRNGRRILGELDFRTGEVAPHGRPAATGLSHYSRGWTRQRGQDPRDTWRAYEDD
jgi:hypothetical protein